MTPALLHVVFTLAGVAGPSGSQEYTHQREIRAAKVAQTIDEFTRFGESLGIKPLTKEQAKSAEHLQGTWSVSSAVQAGMPIKEADLKGLTIVIKGQAFVKLKDGELFPPAISIKWIDATVTPKQLDLDLIVDDHARFTACCIYAVEGKTLTIALGLDNEVSETEIKTKRPTSFKVGKEDKVMVIVLRKVK